VSRDPFSAGDPLQRAELPAPRTTADWQFLVTLNDALRPLGDPVRILAEACRLLGRHLGVNRVLYGEIDGDYCTVVNDYVDGVASMAGRFRWAELIGSRGDEFERGGILVSDDTATDPLTAPERQALQAAEIGAYLGPILIKDGRVVGGMGIHSRTPRVWTADEVALVQNVADRIWATLEQRKAEAALLASEERLFFLLQLNDALRPLSDPAEVQEAAARLLGEHLQVNRVGYAEIEGGHYVIRREYARGVPSLVGQGPVGTFGAALRDAYRRGEVVAVQDVRTDPRFTESERAAFHERQMAAFIGVTLIKGGRLVAAFGVNHATPRLWTPSEIALVRDVAERTWEAVERARAERALREREHRLRLALDASAAGSWTWDAHTNQIDWDDGFRVRYGFPPDEVASSDKWVARVHEEDRPRMLGLLDEMLRSPTKVAWDNSFRIVLPNGAVRWIQSLGRAERDASGAVTRLTGLDLDITVRRRTEEAVQALRDEKRDQQLRLLLETAEQGIVLVDAKGFILTANRALEAMFGWGPGELVGQPIERLLPASLREAHVRHRTSYFRAPRPRPMGADIDLVGERKDGTRFPIEVSLNHVATPDGGQAIAFVADITDRRRVAAALHERTVELERRTAQLSQLASDLTLAEQRAREQLAKTLHDGLQQTLVLVALNLDQQVRAVPRGTPVEPLLQAKSHLDGAITAARSLSFELFPPFLQSSGLPSALQWLADWTRNKYGLEVHVSADPLANTTRKDVRTLLFESVRELLVNAVKYAKVDRVDVDLVLDAEDRLCITVTDEGVGFDSAGLVDPANTRAVGWGLFSIRERLTLLGGRFDVESSPGQGTRLRLIAPRGTAQGVAVQDPLSEQAVGPASGDAAGRASAHALRILIVDDHTAVREVFREILQERPELRVVGDAANGLDAITQAHALRPDVVLMDVSMPDMDGVEATRRLRAELPFITVLGLSMHPRTHALHAIEQAGAAGFFTKGVDTQRLIDHLLVMQAAVVGSLDQPE
jgi:PAS domain S-box-containing protein